jgi:hypothetical protein
LTAPPTARGSVAGHYDETVSENAALDATRGRVMWSLLRTPEWQLKVAAAVPAGILAGVWIGAEARGRILDSVGFTAAFLVAVWFWLYTAADESARGILLADWGRTHDLAFEEFPALGRGTPLLREGESQEAENGLVGELLGKPLVICHFTFTLAGVGDEGGTTHADVQYTVARVRKVDTPVDGLTLHPITGLDRALHTRRASLPHGRVVELESAAMQHHYRLEARTSVSETAVRRIFEPSFIEWCVEERNVLLELEGGELVVGVLGHLAGLNELEDLWDRTRWVLKRVLAASDRTATAGR